MAAQPDFSACADCLCLASRRAARTITRAFDRRLRPHDVRATQLTVLIALIGHGPAPIGALAEALGIERTTLTRNLALLAAAGWIEVRAGEDARARIVAVTRKGRAKAAAALPAWRKAQAAALAAIGPAGSDALLALAQSPIR